MSGIADFLKSALALGVPRITTSSDVRSLSSEKPFVGNFCAGIPFVLQSSGTIDAAGHLSGITALPFAYPSCYMYFPAGALYSASPAGWYYTTMQTTTTATVYGDTYSGGAPTIPASPTPLVTTAGVVTQTTSSDIAAVRFTLPGGMLGPHGQMRVKQMGTAPNNANNKSSNVMVGGSMFGSHTFTTTPAYVTATTVQNLASNYNIGTYYSDQGGSGVDFRRNTVDTAVDQLVTCTLRINAATDFMTLDAVLAELFYGA